MRIIGHRGAAFYEPENTLLSIKKAIEFGVDAVEIDVHLSKDNEVVVIHDDTLERTTNGFGKVSDTNFSALRNLNAGKGEKIPYLQEVINQVKDKVDLIIELKGQKTEKKVVELIQKNNLHDKCYVISFWHNRVKRIKALDPKIKTGALFVGHPVKPYRLAKDAKADALFLNYKFISKKLVEKAHKLDLRVDVWNIDDKKEIKAIADLGVDSIGSNKPDILVEYFKQKEVE